jgi:hypothetical protein
LQIFSIGVGVVDNDPLFAAEMLGIASGPATEHYFNVDTFDNLASIEDDLVLHTCRIPVSGNHFAEENTCRPVAHYGLI